MDPGDHPIFHEIARWKLKAVLKAVQRRVLADVAVLDERGRWGMTPLMQAIYHRRPAIALWLIEHRGPHDVNTATPGSYTALHLASSRGPLAVVQALVAAGADPVALNGAGSTPLMKAILYGQTDIVAFFLQLPAVKVSIDAIGQDEGTALSYASGEGHLPTVQLLLDAGANPTIPAGQYSPLNQAIIKNHHAIAAFLEHAIAEPDRVRECVAALEEIGRLVDVAYSEISEYLLPAWATHA